MINGIINVYKEKGYTSHDVVAKLRGILKQKKIGHTGTLDPDAVGVLPVCLGNATKLCDMLTDKSKEYRTEFLLGVMTDTQDLSGTILEEHKVCVTKEEVLEAIFSFEGEYEQIPPMYSALKVNGKKLYELAREGKTIERQARKVMIEKLSDVEIKLPYVSMTIACSKGTYIRTLCHDIGEKLGCKAAMNTLVRTKVGGFFLDKAISLSQIEQKQIEGTLQKEVFSVESFFEDLEKVIVKKEFRKIIDNGNSLLAMHMEQSLEVEEGMQVCVYNDEGQFCAIYEYSKERDCFLTYKMFPNGEK